MSLLSWLMGRFSKPQIEEVPFHQGMTLYPGQATGFVLDAPLQNMLPPEVWKRAMDNPSALNIEPTGKTEALGNGRWSTSFNVTVDGKDWGELRVTWDQ